jgi:superfamily II DNA or RNA helicase
MLRELAYPPHQEYRTGSAYEPLEFYVNMLMNSNRLDLLLGYFSSSAISLLSLGFAKFITSGGSMRIVINNVLSPKDKEAILRGEHTDEEEFDFSIEKYELIKESLDSYGTHFFECLSWLISSKRVQIVAIKPINKKGISHYKSGIFSDGTNKVKFKGSVNFTAYGLAENLEELGIQTSWKDEAIVFEEYETYFKKIITNQSEHARVIDFSEIESRIVNDFGNKDLEELLINEEELLKSKKKLRESKSFSVVMEDAEEQLNYALNSPKFPFPSGPRDYQKNAFENWKNNKQQGLFAMATGTGKTITALNCLLEVYKKAGYYKAVILVPTITLVNQWESECKEFNFSSIVKVCSKSHWKNDLSVILTRERLSPTEQVSYIIISTYASFARQNIFTELNRLSPKTLLIADECHNLGSNRLLKLLSKVNFKRRIGLSATPERQFDEEGNKKIFSFFNSDESYTYAYPMDEAIKNGVLCRYYYYPHLVSLTEAEMQDYKELSSKISKFFNNELDSFTNNPVLTALLLARKRIIHKAHNKIFTFSKILKEYYGSNGILRYTLIYVPEGNDPNDFFETDHFSRDDETETDYDAVSLIDIFSEAVKSIDKRITVKKFISGTNEKEQILEQFANGDIDVLTSMKCLDEGVDVPRSELAIFCASTGNPRQFVQRRGRILRTHNDKPFAYIHDLVVVPEINANSESYKMERSMLKKELERVNNFAQLSENSSHTINVLLDTMNHYNLNLYKNE